MVRAAVLLSARDVFPQSQLSCWLPSGFFGLVFLLLVSGMVSAQEKNPFADDPKAVKLGESQFRINCAFCHGLGARGGGRGPDLTRAQKRHGHTDEELYYTINEGVPGTAKTLIAQTPGCCSSVASSSMLVFAPAI